jgi:hypothetical protein
VRFQFAHIYKSNREKNKTFDLLGNRFRGGSRAVGKRLKEKQMFFVECVGGSLRSSFLLDE